MGGRKDGVREEGHDSWTGDEVTGNLFKDEMEDGQRKNK